MEQGSQRYRAIRALVERQRRLAASPNLGARIPILWIAATLHKRLGRCTDREIGDLMAIIMERFHIFEPESAICYHSSLRLSRSREGTFNR